MSKPPGVLVETYRGCGMYWYAAGTWYAYAVYDSPCVPGKTFTSPISLMNAIDAALGGEEPPEPTPNYPCPYCGETFYTEAAMAAHIASEHPPAPPPPEENVFIEIYRDVEIWFSNVSNTYTAQVAPGYLAAGFTLEECRTSIDDILAVLYPPEDPEEGLFAQIVAAVQVWVLANMPSWVLQWGEVIQNFITNVTEEITNVYNYVTENITNVINEFSEYVTNVFNTFNEYISNVYNYVTQNITNVLNTFNEYVSNVYNYVTQNITNNAYETITYVTNVIGVLDPFGFLKDPMGYITGAWNLLIDPWAHGIVKSFWEGLEEGLEE